MSIRPLGDKILLTKIEKGERKNGGWFDYTRRFSSVCRRKRYQTSLGRSICNRSKQKDVAVGDWVLMEHGRWTEEYKIDVDGESVSLWMGDPNGVLGISENGRPDGV